MKNFSVITAFAALAAAALVSPAALKAAPPTSTFHFSSDLSDTQQVRFSANGGANFETAAVGRYKGSFGAGPAFNVYCIDVNHDIHLGDSYQADTQYWITDPAGPLDGQYYDGGLASALGGDFHVPAGLTGAQKSQRASEVAYLADNYLGATTLTFSSGASGSTDFKSNLAGIHLAIWDILGDGGDGLGLGNIVGDADTISTYGGITTFYETQAKGHSDYISSTADWLQAPQSSYGQHAQMYVYEQAKPPRPQATPEPGGLALFGIAGLALAVVAVRSRRAGQELS